MIYTSISNKTSLNLDKLNNLIILKRVRFFKIDLKQICLN